MYQFKYLDTSPGADSRQVTISLTDIMTWTAARDKLRDTEVTEVRLKLMMCKTSRCIVLLNSFMAR